ncbi:hypothetical protein [Streptomyces sp. NPDC058476]|uniref:hypothetical protein n=1 Tax=Streptomyces sp. NPDC058476 TaxID=3346519 RepID=UPI00366027ED
MAQAEPARAAPPRRQIWPLYAAGFTSALGAHGIAANLGGFSDDAVTSLRLSARGGITTGLLITAVVLGCATLPGLPEHPDYPRILAF